jgi:uncharacterized LabA/DUF88 family protein
MTPDDIRQLAEKALPHEHDETGVCLGDCPSRFRPAVEAAIREGYRKGRWAGAAGFAAALKENADG